jgi:hypothetical protein
MNRDVCVRLEVVLTDPDAAASSYTRSLLVNARVNLGMCAWSRRSYADAQTHLLSALSGEPGHAVAAAALQQVAIDRDSDRGQQLLRDAVDAHREGGYRAAAEAYEKAAEVRRGSVACRRTVPAHRPPTTASMLLVYIRTHPALPLTISL